MYNHFDWQRLQSFNDINRQWLRLPLWAFCSWRDIIPHGAHVQIGQLQEWSFTSIHCGIEEEFGVYLLWRGWQHFQVAERAGVTETAQTAVADIFVGALFAVVLVRLLILLHRLFHCLEYFGIIALVLQFLGRCRPLDAIGWNINIYIIDFNIWFDSINITEKII